MLEKIAVWLSIGTFLFWSSGIIADPEKASIAGWVAWAVICFSVAISRVYAKQPSALWFTWGIGDVCMILLILYCGGQNWAFEKNAFYLGFGVATLTFSFLFGKGNPKLGEFLGGLALACAYIPHIVEWMHSEAIVPIGLSLATAASVASPVLLGVYSYKKTNIIGIGNIVAALSAGVYFLVLLF